MAESKNFAFVTLKILLQFYVFLGSPVDFTRKTLDYKGGTVTLTLR